MAHYDNGKRRFVFISDKNGALKYSKEWYESGKLKSKTKFLKLDTAEIFDSSLNCFILVPYASEEMGKEWYESGKLKKQISMKSTGVKQYIYWSEYGVKMKEELYSTNKLISTTIFSTDSTKIIPPLK